MGHLVDVQDHGTARHVGTQAGGDAALVVAELGGLQDVTEVDGGGLGVGHLDTHGGLAGDGGLDTHAGLGQVHGDVVHQVGDGADADTRIGLDLKAGNGGAAGAGDLLNADVEALQHVTEQAGVLRDLLVVGLVAGASLGEHIHRGELILMCRGGGLLGGVMSRRDHQLLLRQSRLGHGGVFLLVDGDHYAVGGLCIRLVDHRVVPSRGSGLGGGQLLFFFVVVKRRGIDGRGGLLLQIGGHGVAGGIVELGLTVIHGGGGAGILCREVLGHELPVLLGGLAFTPVHLGGIVAVFGIVVVLLGRGRLIEGQAGQILVVGGRLGGSHGGNVRIHLLQHLSRLAVHDHAAALARGVLGRRPGLCGRLGGGICRIGGGLCGGLLGAAALGIHAFPLLSVGLGGGGLTLLLGLSLLLLAAESLLLGGALTPCLDGGAKLTEHVGGGHAHQQHDDQGKSHHGQGDGAGELQTCEQGVSHQTAHHAAALKEGARAEQMIGGVHLRHGGILGTDTHVDDGGDHDHEQDGKDHLQGHQILLAVTPPEDGEVYEDQGDEVGGPAEASEEDVAEVVADEACGMGRGGIRARQGVQHQEHREDKRQSREYVGQILLREGAPSLDLGGLLTLHPALLGLFGGGSYGSRALAGIFAGIFRLGLGGGFGCGGGRYDPTGLGLRRFLLGIPLALGGGRLFLVGLSHTVTSSFVKQYDGRGRGLMPTLRLLRSV